MITDRELTPEEHTMIIRSLKSTPPTALVFAVVTLSLRTVGLWRGQTIFEYGFAIVGLAWLVAGSRNGMR